MIKNILITILFLLLTQFTQLSAKEQRKITLYGKVDPRLYVNALSTFRSMDPNDIRKNYQECTKANWNTGHRGRTLGFETAPITPDTDGNYKIEIPIDYEVNNPCGYEYVDTEITIRRDKKDTLYSKITVLSNKNRASNIYRGYETGQAGLGKRIKGISTTKNHYQISSGSKIECYTRYFIYEKRTSTNFICEPVVASDINGVDNLKSDSINVDIIINNQSIFYDTTDVNFVRGVSTPDNFRDYKEPLNFFEKIIHYLKNQIKG